MSDSSAPGAGPSTPADTLTRETKNKFLEVYASIGNVRETAAQTGIHRSTHYDWLKHDPDYAERFGEAESQYCDLVRETVRQRAILGVSHDVFNGKGDYVGTRTVYSDRLLERLAEAKCPEFKRKTELTGPGGGAVQISVITGVPQPDNEKEQ